MQILDTLPHRILNIIVPHMAQPLGQLLLGGSDVAADVLRQELVQIACAARAPH